jgi:hypothetical protein
MSNVTAEFDSVCLGLSRIQSDFVYAVYFGDPAPLCAFGIKPKAKFGQVFILLC